MNKKCPVCQLTNFPDAKVCVRCGSEVTESLAAVKKRSGSRIVLRGVVCIVVCLIVVLGFYLSLIGSAKSLSPDQGYQARKAIAVLNERGFSNEIFLLQYFTVFRSEDNWLNAAVAKENAYAATNFPFEIITIYPDFFTYTIDDTERAAILLHESRHLRGQDEHDAYKFVWEHRKQLGWTKDKYSRSVIWRNVRKQTRENVPELFVCDFNDLEFSDCTE